MVNIIVVLLFLLFSRQLVLSVANCIMRQTCDKFISGIRMSHQIIKTCYTPPVSGEMQYYILFMRQ